MAYTRQTWADNDPTRPLSAARLNYIEQGIVDAHSLNSPSTALINVFDEGAVGNDIADDRAAIQSALNKAMNAASLGLPAVVQLGRRHRIGSPGITTSGGGFTVQGYGAPTGTVLSHTAGFGGWLWTHLDGGRTNEKQATDAQWVPDDDGSGAIFRNFTISGRDRAAAATKNGMRIARADDLRMSNFEVNYCNGIGLQLGNVDGFAAGEVGSIRESHFHNIRIMFCGNGPNVPAMRIGSNSIGTSDGTNQLYFLNLDMVYNYGGLHIVNHNTDEIVRRIQIYQMQNHGISHGGTVGNLTDYDLIKIEGDVREVHFDGLITNSSGANHAVLRTAPSTVDTGFANYPRGISIQNFSCSSADGDVFVFERCENFYLYNLKPNMSAIGGRLVHVPSGSGLQSYIIMGGQTNQTDNSAKFSIAADVAGRGSLVWAPTNLVGSGGVVSESPYAAFIVDDSSGQYPLRSDVTSDSSKPVICVGDSNPYTSGRGYLTGKDVWLDPQ